jgi:hypothetical protein
MRPSGLFDDPRYGLFREPGFAGPPKILGFDERRPPLAPGWYTKRADRDIDWFQIYLPKSNWVQ